MPLLRIYVNRNKKDPMAVYCGLPWEWNGRTKELTIYTSKTDGIVYICRILDISNKDEVIAYQEE